MPSILEQHRRSRRDQTSRVVKLENEIAELRDALLNKGVLNNADLPTKPDDNRPR